MTTKKKIVFVVNPISGTQGKRAILKWIDERINRTLMIIRLSKHNMPAMLKRLRLQLPKRK